MQEHIILSPSVTCWFSLCHPLLVFSLLLPCHGQRFQQCAKLLTLDQPCWFLQQSNQCMHIHCVVLWQWVDVHHCPEWNHLGAWKSAPLLGVWSAASYLDPHLRALCFSQEAHWDTLQEFQLLDSHYSLALWSQIDRLMRSLPEDQHDTK